MFWMGVTLVVAMFVVVAVFRDVFHESEEMQNIQDNLVRHGIYDFFE